MKTISPITWPGGKAKHFDKIKQFLPKDMKIFIEPFCGGASVGLNIIQQQLARIVYFNDLNTDLINFWKNINNINIEKISQISYPNVKTIEELQQKLKELNFNDSEKFLINNALTFNGNAWGTYTDLRLKQNFNGNKIKKVLAIQNLLNNFYLSNETSYYFYNQDYKNIINLFGNDKDIVWYLDPPYFYNKGKPYQHSKINFQELKTYLLKIKGRWILSIDNSLVIKELFQEFNIYQFEWFYTSTNCHSKKLKLGKELIITNFKN